MKYYLILFVLIFFSQNCKNKVKDRRNYNSESNGGQIDPNTSSGDNSPKTKAADSNKTLIWKRYRPLESGLMSGLGLTKDQLCQELGSNSCIDKVHLTVLGGNEPFIIGQYERAQSPTVLTSVAIDRIVLSACSKRLELDITAGAGAQVFKNFPLNATKPNAEQIKQLSIELYRRLLARDPEAAELQITGDFGAAGTAGDKIALGLCFAIGTSAENIFL